MLCMVKLVLFRFLLSMCIFVGVLVRLWISSMFCGLLGRKKLCDLVIWWFWDGSGEG